MTTFAFKVTDKSGNFPVILNVTRLDYNWNGQIKTKAIASAPDGQMRGDPRFLDFGRKVEGFVAYGVMTSWAQVVDIRAKLNGVDANSDDVDDNGGNWWMNRECRFYITSSDYHKGAVADFKCYLDRTTGGEGNIKFTLTFVVADKFFQSF